MSFTAKPDELGVAALRLAQQDHKRVAQILKSCTYGYDTYTVRLSQYSNDHRTRALLLIPIDLFDEWEENYAEPALAAFRFASEWNQTSLAGLKVSVLPKAAGWRERLSQVTDWGGTDDWWAINEKVEALKDVYRRSVTDEDFKDVGRRCRDLIIAAVNRVFVPDMVPEGSEQPKGADAKARFDYILDSVADKRRSDDMRKLLRHSINLAMTLTHSGEDRDLDTLVAAQSTIVVVRFLNGVAERGLVK